MLNKPPNKYLAGQHEVLDNTPKSKNSRKRKKSTPVWKQRRQQRHCTNKSLAPSRHTTFTQLSLITGTVHSLTTTQKKKHKRKVKPKNNASEKH